MKEEFLYPLERTKKMKDILIKAVANDAPIKITVLNSKEIVERAREIHNTMPVVTAALGRALTGAAILGCDLKSEKSSLTLRIKGDGPIGTVLCVADSEGNPRGYAQNPFVDIKRKTNGKLDVGTAIGAGYLTITKDIGMKKPFNGMCELVSGEIAEDITAYLLKSEQIKSAVALGVLVSSDLSVKCAGGYIVQAMPGATDEHILAIENAIEKAGPITGMLDKGMSALDIAHTILADFDISILSKGEIKYKCSCSDEKVESVIISLGMQEINDIITEGEKTDITCQFCDKVYSYSTDDMIEILEKSKK